MRNVSVLIAIAFALLFSASAEAGGHRIKRSHVAIQAFKFEHHCPSTGESKGSCPGWIVDHVVPLCAGGADTPENMQWQTVADAKEKDRQERAQCQSLRKISN